jgi:acyl-coenzyme A thioesterase PaaI-like protein
MSLVDEVGGGLDALSQLCARMASGRKPGILVALDFEFVGLVAGRAVLLARRGSTPGELPGEHTYNPIGDVHSGYAAALLDSACACAVHSPRTTSQACTAVELKVAYHKPVTRDTGLL